MADDRNDAAGYLGWFFLGGLIGAASALLLAPKTGREMRDQLRDQLLEHGGEFARRCFYHDQEPVENAAKRITC